MKLLQSCKSILKSVMIGLVICLFLFTPLAIASTDNMSDVISKEVSVQKGAFKVTRSGTIKEPIKIKSAIVSLPKGESGTIDSIKITDSNKKLEFGCEKLDVVNGTDLIKSCGGFADLKEGQTIYKARGSKFKPNPNTTLSIKLNPN